ncbi:unnamed protein product [Caenorhabditis brenneri]
MPVAAPIPPASLAKMTQKYTPYTIRNSVVMGSANSNCVVCHEGKELDVMKQFTTASGMFGTPEELWEQFQVFADFQRNNQYFGVDNSIHYNNNLHLYDQFNGEKKFICKNDIFLYIQKKLLETEDLMMLRPILIMLTYFLHNYESKLKGAIEFVPFDQKQFDELDKELAQISVKMRKAGTGPLVTMQRGGQGVLNRFKELLPFHKPDSEMIALLGIFDWLMLGKNGMTVEQNTATIAACHSYCRTMIPCLKKIIEDRPSWFMPNEMLPRKLVRPVLRMLTDGEVELVLSQDIYGAATVLNPSFNPNSCLKPESGFVDALDFEATATFLAFHRVGEKDVDFIRFPIKRAKHSAVPIPINSGLICKSSMDVFLELIRDMFFGTCVYQSPDHKELMTMWEQELLTIFHWSVEELYFIDNLMIDQLDQVCATRIPLESPKKTIRDVPKVGFTAKDLKQELEHLGMEKFFEDVFDHVELAYRTVVKRKKKVVLRTCDMFDAVEHCLQLSLLKKVPKLVSFVHNQQACHRIPGLQCDRCDEEKKNPKKKQVYIQMLACTMTHEDGTPAGPIKKIKVGVVGDDINMSVEEMDQTAMIIQSMAKLATSEKPANKTKK